MSELSYTCHYKLNCHGHGLTCHGLVGGAVYLVELGSIWYTTMTEKLHELIGIKTKEVVAIMSADFINSAVSFGLEPMSLTNKDR